MEKLFSYLEKVTGVNNLENRSWQDVVDNIILPMMAYPANQRNRIGNAFMKFMAEFTQDVCRKDEHLGEIMLEIAMQRISDGAVLHPVLLLHCAAGADGYRRFLHGLEHAGEAGVRRLAKLRQAPAG